jgi:Protein of unknown function (DUF2793)
MSSSARFALPFISAGQAQKEFTHNEALQALELVTAAAVEDVPSDTPPAAPLVGACYLVSAAPTGAWSGHAKNLAGYTSGGWRFVPPQEGLSAYVKTTGTFGVYRAGSWDVGTVRASSIVIGGQQVVGARAAAIASPAGGSTVDAEGRAAISAILAALRLHGLIET